MTTQFVTIHDGFKLPDGPNTMSIQRLDSSVAPELRITGTPGMIRAIDRLLYGLSVGNLTVVNRARFERVLDVAEAADGVENAPDGEILAEQEDLLIRALDALKSGDLDPLP